VFSDKKNTEKSPQEILEAEKNFIVALKKKKMWAYELLYSKYANMVGGIARSYLNVDDVEDVIQEVFFRIYKSIKRFKGDSAFSTWLYRITVNVCKDILAKYSKRSETFTDFEDEDNGGVPEPSSEVDIEADIRQQFRIEDFRTVLGELSEEDNLFITLRDIEGLDYEEISKITEKPLGTVKSRIYYARKRLKSLLEKYGIGD